MKGLCPELAAQRFVEAMHGQWLPPLYKLGSVDMRETLTEFELARSYRHGSATEKEAVASSRLMLSHISGSARRTTTSMSHLCSSASAILILPCSRWPGSARCCLAAWLQHRWQHAWLPSTIDSWARRASPSGADQTLSRTLRFLRLVRRGSDTCCTCRRLYF